MRSIREGWWHVGRDYVGEPVSLDKGSLVEQDAEVRRVRWVAQLDGSLAACWANGAWANETALSAGLDVGDWSVSCQGLVRLLTLSARSDCRPGDSQATGELPRHPRQPDLGN